MRTSLGLAAVLGAAAVAVQAQIPHFDHVVVVVQENRTPDNLFQGPCSFPFGSSLSCETKPTADPTTMVAQQYNIQTGNWLDKTSATGVTQPGVVALANKYDLSHAHTAFLKQ